jgi:hypothetical protein
MLSLPSANTLLQSLWLFRAVDGGLLPRLLRIRIQLGKNYPRTRARVTCDSRWNLRRTTWINSTVLRLEEYTVLPLSRWSRDHLCVPVVNHVT